ncbi:YozE family protein [Jeotgalibacillus aurantiacus]|uniref:YozE family protein n=1 Tax=Jeotgalibacillus aurantiacus TaxID=2763266 RepID=UPI001D0A56B7|nr:YozE family protein [Jeotgalibacillus aurantiacus]
MSKSFYHFVMKYREPKPRNNKELLANRIYDDLDFPKNLKSYNDVSQYIETTDLYSSLASTFDEVWEEYTTNNKN